MKKFFAVTAAIGVAAAALIGAPAAHAAGTTLTYGVVTDIKDWQASSGQFAHFAPYYQAVYSTLLKAKADGSLAPGLALTYTYDAAKTTLTLKLRQGVKFTDGEAFDAAAVVKNLLAFGKGASPNASQARSIASVTAKDASTVVIKLSAVDPSLTMYLSNTLGEMQAPNTIGTADAKSTPVGTGPYILDKSNSVSGSSYAFTANPNYWDKANRKFDNLVIKYLPTAAAAVNALKAGQVDCVALMDASTVASTKAAGYNVQKQQLNWVGLTLNDKSGKAGSPFKNVLVRQAINYGFDRDAALKIMGSGYGVVTNQVFASYNKGFVKALDDTYPYDLAKAKSLLAQAGYPNGFTLSMPQNTALPPVVFQFLKDSLAQMGITVNYTALPSSDYIAAVQANKFVAYRMGLERNPSDWTLLNFLITKDAPWNPAGFSDQISASMIDTIRRTSGDTQVKAYQALNTYITKQAWFVPLYAQDVYFAAGSKVNVNLHSGNAIPFLGDITPAN